VRGAMLSTIRYGFRNVCFNHSIFEIVFLNVCLIEQIPPLVMFASENTIRAIALYKIDQPETVTKNK